MNNRICSILGIEKPVIQGPMYGMADRRKTGSSGQ